MQLDGHFKVEHNDCGENKFCGDTTNVEGSSFEDHPILIQTVLDPCTNHTGIQIKAGMKVMAMDLTNLSQSLSLYEMYIVDTGDAILWTRNWDAINCTDAKKAEVKYIVGQSAEAKEIMWTNFFTEDSFKNSIILTCIALVVIIFVSTTVSVCVICKKQNKKKRLAEIKMDTNPEYGTYEEGPVYNSITDENYYYSS